MTTSSSAHPFRSKLDFTKAESMRRLSLRGESAQTLARQFGVCLSSVYDVLAGRTHAPTVTVRLRAKEFTQLLRLARDRGESCEEFAGTLLRQGVGRAIAHELKR